MCSYNHKTLLTGDVVFTYADRQIIASCWWKQRRGEERLDLKGISSHALCHTENTARL